MQFPLSDEIVETKSGSDTSMQPYLQLTVAVEKMDFEVINKIANDLSINIEEVFEIFKAANKWSNRIS